MRLVKFISIESPLRGTADINRLNVDKLIVNGRKDHGYTFVRGAKYLNIIKRYDRKIIYEYECYDEYCWVQERRLYDNLYIYRWSQQNPRTIIKEFQLHYANTNHISFVRNNNATVTIFDTIIIYIEFAHRGYDRIKFYCSYVNGDVTIHRAQIPSCGRPELVINV